MNLKLLGLVAIVLGELIASVGCGVGLGYLLVEYAHMDQWIIAPTTFVGLVLGMTRISQVLKKWMQ